VWTICKFSNLIISNCHPLLAIPTGKADLVLIKTAPTLIPAIMGVVMKISIDPISPVYLIKSFVTNWTGYNISDNPICFLTTNASPFDLWLIKDGGSFKIIFTNRTRHF